ncbi:MAG: hypothetical protein P4L43_04480 [Syntrophobacteraceae bacterium]|nr:hypothetical protein [Syntrophobacteraceae bacterium]
MNFDIQLRFRPSEAFIGILAELNDQFFDWTDGSYDWANQTVDFLHASAPLPRFDESVFKTPLSRRAINDLLQVAIALLAGNYPLVRDYLKNLRFAFVIGYPRSGGSYLVKELLRTVGFDHTRVSEELAHDGFPDLRETWYDWAGERPYFYLQEAIFQTAEFLVIANLYYRVKSGQRAQGARLAPKKMHKMVNWAGSFKMLLGHGQADYLVTVRHPLPTAISVAEKSGGFPADGRFPALAPRSAIERWIMTDLMHLGFTMGASAAMDYFEAVFLSWSLFHTSMATSGLFLGDRDEIRLVAYGDNHHEPVVRDYRERYGDPQLAPEPFMVHDKAREDRRWIERGDASVGAVTQTWSNLGLRFPELSLQ